MKFNLLLIIFTLSANLVFGQSVRSLNNDGVESYNNKKYSDSEVNFKKSIEKDKSIFENHFNLGSSYYKQKRYDEALKSYNKALSLTDDKMRKSKAYYNMGNAFLKNQKIDEAINSYKSSLKLDPKDLETKYNLSYALKMKQQQQQNKDQNKNQDNKDNKDNKDQNKQNDKDKKDDKNKDNKDQQNQDQQDKKNDQKNDQKQNQPQQQKDKLSKQEAQRMLEAMKNNESDLQKKLRKVKANTSSREKDW